MQKANGFPTLKAAVAVYLVVLVTWTASIFLLPDPTSSVYVLVILGILGLPMTYLVSNRVF